MKNQVNAAIEKTENSLRAAQQTAYALFDEIEQRRLIVAGKTERELSDEVFQLADELYGIKKHWHKRIVRTGKNTVEIYSANPPDLTIEPNDILFFDFGPIFEDYEADFGKTYVLGHDPEKIKLRDALQPLFDKAKAFYQTNPDITGEEYYQAVVNICEQDGFIFGGKIAGHVIGEFPHERVAGSGLDYVAPGCTKKMTAPDEHGNIRQWILEIHLLNASKEWGGFYEDLLTL